jgi:hypothetical protein
MAFDFLLFFLSQLSELTVGGSFTYKFLFYLLADNVVTTALSLSKSARLVQFAKSSFQFIWAL